ncbi:FKBP-type peptidyl-prolyl cis-trans isomerase [Cellvibrio polysaccharolyticus]|uniref:Peptidyl-prolyl cis-trans isomerase n=1 Tax=Cellvibrio polysaccharolyticus TaxID=2082724 RepID=A0A928V541_9GAMM|nr:FKBP-type peptidyl-prolyl cis-trans isomerase [Cellvibrio polysaccharolyticus]MBE8716762.1 FKBP-type peptidyl-prolyl cis-trans isomerase [Cellvibrio polysaccharolyticus]
MTEQYLTPEAKASYGIGRQMGEQLAANPFEGVVNSAVAAGLIDALEGKESTVSRADLEAAFGVISQRMQEVQAAKAKELAGAGEAFLAENAKKAGITTTASGLQYEVITEGEGAKPTATSRVKTHYHGTLIDGTVFDSSYDRGQPIDFAVNGVIAGWTEALQLMPVGSKWRLYVPYNLAYGERGAGAAIGPFSTLIFDVELLDIVG